MLAESGHLEVSAELVLEYAREHGIEESLAPQLRRQPLSGVDALDEEEKAELAAAIISAAQLAAVRRRDLVRSLHLEDSLQPSTLVSADAEVLSMLVGTKALDDDAVAFGWAAAQSVEHALAPMRRSRRFPQFVSMLTIAEEVLRRAILDENVKWATKDLLTQHVAGVPTEDVLLDGDHTHRFPTHLRRQVHHRHLPSIGKDEGEAVGAAHRAA